MTLQERLERHLGLSPVVGDCLFIAPGATVVGDVVLGPSTSVFYGAVLRGDINSIRASSRSLSSGRAFARPVGSSQ
jgi:carbonic anhydrase/acetyltransferase-like protein (isoleucine patch superfamily)